MGSPNEWLEPELQPLKTHTHTHGPMTNGFEVSIFGQALPGILESKGPPTTFGSSCQPERIQNLVVDQVTIKLHVQSDAQLRGHFWSRAQPPHSARSLNLCKRFFIESGPKTPQAFNFAVVVLSMAFLMSS